MAIRDKPIAPASPSQNAFAERLIGSMRRECVGHLIVLGEAHLRRILRSYAGYYNEIRTHRSLNKDAPISRTVQRIGTSNHTPSSADFITITSGFSFRHTQGVTTDVCLIFPAIDAALEGFAVQAVMDASAPPASIPKNLRVTGRMRDAGVVLTATNTLIAEIAQDWSTPAGQQLIGLLFSDVFPALGAGIASDHKSRLPDGSRAARQARGRVALRAAGRRKRLPACL